MISLEGQSDSSNILEQNVTICGIERTKRQWAEDLKISPTHTSMFTSTADTPPSHLEEMYQTVTGTSLPCPFLHIEAILDIKGNINQIRNLLVAKEDCSPEQVVIINNNIHTIINNLGRRYQLTNREVKKILCGCIYAEIGSYNPIDQNLLLDQDDNLPTESPDITELRSILLEIRNSMKPGEMITSQQITQRILQRGNFNLKHRRYFDLKHDYFRKFRIARGVYQKPDPSHVSPTPLSNKLNDSTSQSTKSTYHPKALYKIFCNELICVLSESDKPLSTAGILTKLTNTFTHSSILFFAKRRRIKTIYNYIHQHKDIFVRDEHAALFTVRPECRIPEERLQYEKEVISKDLELINSNLPAQDELFQSNATHIKSSDVELLSQRYNVSRCFIHRRLVSNFTEEDIKYEAELHSRYKSSKGKWRLVAQLDGHTLRPLLNTHKRKNTSKTALSSVQPEPESLPVQPEPVENSEGLKITQLNATINILELKIKQLQDLYTTQELKLSKLEAFIDQQFKSKFLL